MAPSAAGEGTTRERPEPIFAKAVTAPCGPPTKLLTWQIGNVRERLPTAASSRNGVIDRHRVVLRNLDAESGSGGR